MNFTVARRPAVTVLLLLATLFLAWLTCRPATAQLVLVNGAYRVVAIDSEGYKIGIALPPDNPDVPQNWLHLKINTAGYVYGGGQLNANQIINTVHKGQLIWVSGGRRVDGGITADKIWF